MQRLLFERRPPSLRSSGRNEATRSSVRALPAFQERLRREVPVQRLGTPSEDAMLAVFLASDECRFMVGQSVPFAGGWVT